jgi:hypothetical protein
MFILYKTDAQHSYASRDIISICDSKKIVIAMCHAKADKEGEKLSEDDLYNLENISQTQGYAGEGEFHFETFRPNILL